MGGNLLSDAALHQVRELIKQESGRARGERTWEEPDPTTGPECFLAYTATAIPAMTLESLGYTPGYALCNIYKLDRFSGVLEDLKLDSDTPNRRGVYNASTSTVGAGWFPVWRDKSGTWWATASGSSAECAFSGNQPGFPRPEFDNRVNSVDWPVVNVIVHGSSLITADTVNHWWNIAGAGVWHIWGSVTVSVDTADEQTTHVLSYSTDGGTVWSTLDRQYRVHPAAGISGTHLDVIYLAGANTMTANTRVRIASKTDTALSTGWMFESNLHFLRT